MLWITFALLGYLFQAFSTLLDKFLLADRIREPAVYAFFVSLFSFFIIILVPFGMVALPLPNIALFLLSGSAFLFGLVAFYTAVKTSEISRVAPLVGITTAALTAGVSLMSQSHWQSVTPGAIGALFFLLLGAFLVAFDLPLRPNRAFQSATVIAGAFMALSLLSLKAGYHEGNYVTGLVWSRLGIFLAGLSLLMWPRTRSKILAACSAPARLSKRRVTTGAWFLVNKASGSLSSLVLIYAAYLGPVTFVQGLNGAQYVFLLIFTLPLAHRFPQLFAERLTFGDWFQKMVAIVLIALGSWWAVMAAPGTFFV